MNAAKQKLVQEFVSGCMELNLSVEEMLELAAHNLIGAVNASGKSYVKIELDNVGVVEVEC
ncbi:hypothetical protein [Vibrio sp. CyArs1]|uniref:hypothetical protein n=1 Tax=Vibrio sp. CyArs1 TaxID=2682577 RepID=UPI001F055A61|nr:hypothetical protein [Vibrio sp. CyArs1]